MNKELEQAEILSDIKTLHKEIERVRQEAVREGSEQSNGNHLPLLNDYLKTMRIGVLLHDHAARIVECNAAAAALLDAPVNDLLQMSAYDMQWDIIREDGTPFPLEDLPVPQVLKTGAPVHDIVMGVRRERENERVWLLVNVDPIADRRGETTHVVCYFTNISERRRIEENLRESESRYRFLFEGIPLPAWVYDAETLAFLAVNRAAVQQYGYTQDEFLEMTMHGLRLRDDGNDASSTARLLFDESESSKHVRRDGSIIDVRIMSQAILFNQREARMVIAENITERRQAERALRKANRRLGNILESIRDGFVTLDKQSNCTYMNHRAERIFQIGHDSLVGRNLWEVVPGLRDTAFHTACQRASARQTPANLEQFLPEFCVWVEINVHPSQDGLSIYMTNVTESKRVQEELRQSIETLKRSVDGIVRAMSYAVELRDPYTAGHQKRVSLLVCAMARQIGMGEDDIKRFRVAALLHDIGKIAMPAEILSKPGQLSKAEMSIIQGHAQLGYDILKGIDIAPQIALVALQHHERLDGSGYPNGLGGSDIIHEARMMAVADVVEAMASHRPFRPSLGIEKALNEVMRNKGILYDVEAVEACLAAFAQNAFDFEHLLRAEQACLPED